MHYAVPFLLKSRIRSRFSIIPKYVLYGYENLLVYPFPFHPLHSQSRRNLERILEQIFHTGRPTRTHGGFCYTRLLMWKLLCLKNRISFVPILDSEKIENEIGIRETLGRGSKPWLALSIKEYVLIRPLWNASRRNDDICHGPGTTGWQWWEIQALIFTCYDDFQWGPAAFNFDLVEKPNNTLPRLLLRVWSKSTKIGIHIQRVITSPEALIADDVWPQDEYNAGL